jgi:exopolysaccharide biosynthesis polyprenyl glycosylphosphotransferase
MKGPNSRVAPRLDALPLSHVSSVSLATQVVLLRIWLGLTDALALMLAFRAAYWVRFDLQVTLAPDVVPDPAFYPTLAAVLVPLWLVVLAGFNLYDGQKKLGGLEESSKIFNACSAATMLVIVATFIWPQFVVSRLWLVSAWLLSFIAVAASRFFARRFVYALRRRGWLLTPAVIVGTNEEAASLAAYLGDWRLSGLRLVGVVAVSEAPDEVRDLGLPVLGTTRQIRTIVAEHGIEDLIVAITAVKREELLWLSEEIDPWRNVCLRLSSGLYELLTTRVTVRNFGTVPLLQVDKFRLTPAEAWLKRAVDYPLAIVGVLVLSPLLLLLAALVKLDSPGPVLHRRRVLGVSRKPFDAFKFRTMHVDGDRRLAGNPAALAQLRSEHKLKDDPRVTRVGAWLRKFSLDELPQLFNVLAGQMSLVGPRMISPEEADKYGRHRLNLLAVKPGITGLWQVSGRSELSYDERVRIDMYYVRNYSVWLDLQILFIQTLPAVLRGRGAY